MKKYPDLEKKRQELLGKNIKSGMPVTEKSIHLIFDEMSWLREDIESCNHIHIPKFDKYKKTTGK